jgi:hypothetical protein
MHGWRVEGSGRGVWYVRGPNDVREGKVSEGEKSITGVNGTATL